MGQKVKKKKKKAIHHYELRFPGQSHQIISKTRDYNICIVKAVSV